MSCSAIWRGAAHSARSGAVGGAAAAAGRCSSGAAALPATGGRALVGALVDCGVGTVFGIPAAQTVAIYHALRERRGEIRHITARHEQGAGFMAEGYARATGRVGVACVVTGVGLANALTPMASALADSVPLLVVSSQVPSFWRDMPARQYNHFLPRSSEGVAASASKRSFSVASPSDIAPVIREAHDLALRGRPGPVHVEVPVDALRAAAAVPAAAPVAVAPMAACADRPGATALGLSVEVEAKLRDAAARLWRCKRPLIIIGGGIVSAAESETGARRLAALAEALAAPVAATIAAKGALDERHPLALGTRLHVLPHCTQLLQQADGILLLGTQLSPVDWWLRSIDEEVPLSTAAAARVMIQVDVDSSTLAQCARAAPRISPIQCDASLACAYLLEAFTQLRSAADAPPASSRWGGNSHQVVLDAKAAADSPAALSGLGIDFVGGIGEQMQATLGALREALPEEAVVSADLCRLVYLAWSLLAVYKPRSFLYPVGAGPLGFGLPAAIGAALAKPGVPVVALVGDGGFQFSLQELAVAAEYKLPVLVVLWNNCSLGEVRHHLGDDFANFDPAAPLPNFGQLCSAYGVPHVLCRTADDFNRAVRGHEVQHVLEGAGGPVVLEVFRPDAGGMD